MATGTPGPVALIDVAPQRPEPEVEIEIEEEVAHVSVVEALEAVASPEPERERGPQRAAPPPPVAAIATLGSLVPPPVAPEPPPSFSREQPVQAFAPAPQPQEPRRVRGPSSYAPAEVAPAKPVKKDSRTMWAMFAVAGIVFAVGARLSRDRQDVAAPAAEPTAVAAAATAQEAPAEPFAAPAPTATAAAASANDTGSKANPILPQDVPLKDADKVPPGQGMVEIVAGVSDTLYIDGTLVGNGPVVRRALAPRKDPYEVRVKLRGEERTRFVAVQPNRLSRVRIAPPWQR